MSIPQTAEPSRHQAHSKQATRREQNKQATRQAISAAALNVLRTKGVGNFTVEDIAEEAGVSRRTFFNYFSGLEAALASVTEGFLDHALEQFRRRPADEPIIESARAALVALADPMTVSPMAELFSLTQASPALARCELEAWDHCTTQIIDAARERLGPDVDELYLRALAGSIISCGKAAMSVWFEQCGQDLSAESLGVLRARLIEAIGILGSGFAA
ncbi:TetR/AcrR family transcriptional regulator [bacterium RCC_150]